MEYSFENFTILDKKKNGKADKIHFTVLEDILLRCDCVGVDLFNGLANTKPYTQICKDLYDASLICKRWFLQNREVLHHAIMYDVLIRINRITISAGASGLLLSFCSAAVSCIMPQKASSSKTFCHKLPDFT